jgi:hypothetical protein
MRRHLRRRINDTELSRHGDTYDGVLTAVTEENVRNRFTAQREVVPVLVFADGWTWIPNMSARTALVEMFGHDTDAWIGRRIRIFRRRVEQVDRATGEVKLRFVKAVMLPDTSAAEQADYDDTPVPTTCEVDGEPRQWPECATAITSDEIFGKRRAH